MRLGPFADVEWWVESESGYARYNGQKWGVIPLREDWRIARDMYLFGPGYMRMFGSINTNNIPGWTKDAYVLRRSGQEWDKGIAGSLEDLWPAYLTWKLTGVLEHITPEEGVKG